MINVWQDEAAKLNLFTLFWCYFNSTRSKCFIYLGRAEVELLICWWWHISEPVIEKATELNVLWEEDSVFNQLHWFITQSCTQWCAAEVPICSFRITVFSWFTCLKELGFTQLSSSPSQLSRRLLLTICYCYKTFAKQLTYSSSPKSVVLTMITKEKPSVPSN